jgi:hypothetical protein
MRRTASAVTIVFAVAICVPLAAAAQQPVRSFDALDTRLKPGDTIWVTDAEGREIKGKVQGLSPASLRVKSEGATQEFPQARVATIKHQPRDPLKNGVLWGALMGFAGGAASCAANPECIDDEGGPGITIALSIVGAAAGAGIGPAVDASVKGPKLVVFRAPAASGITNLSVAPMITPRAEGVAVSFAF